MNAIEHAYVSLLADVALKTEYREIRGSYEGLQWVLHEAPKLEKQVLRAVETGESLDLSVFPVWLRRLALGSLTDPIQMRYLRQLLLFCYKALVTHDNTTTNNSIESFFETNSAVGRFGDSLSRQSPRLLNVTRKHVHSVLYPFRGKAIKPSHGPGATTTPKGRWAKQYATIAYVYNYADWFCLYYNQHHIEQLEHAVDDHITAKLIAVPKDSRGPRLICVHPAESVWIQQGLRRELERVISLRRSHPGPWPRGHVFFDDQSVNGKIALLSSRSRRYATLDMKEASDRIAEPLVQCLFGRYYKYFGCCRAQKLCVGSDSIRHDIACYAPMGNATTFPVQSLVFWAICVSTLQYLNYRQPGAVFVFGDDIIVPSECAESVINALESFGLLVNRSKSFYRGAFRESCGVDAFNGVNVTPIRWKTTLDADDVTGLLSLSDLAMRLRIAGYEETASTCYAILRWKLRSRYGRCLYYTNNVNHGSIAEYTRDIYAWSNAYWHKDLQRYVSPVWQIKVVELQSSTHDWNHVLESVLSLERTGRSSIPDRGALRRLCLNRGWTDVV